MYSNKMDHTRKEREASVRFVLCIATIDTDPEKQAYAERNMDEITKLDPKLFRVVLKSFRWDSVFCRVHELMLDKVSSIDGMFETLGCTDRPDFQKLVVQNIAKRLARDGIKITPEYLLASLTKMKQAEEMRALTIDMQMCETVKSLLPLVEYENQDGLVLSEILSFFGDDFNADHHIREMVRLFYEQKMEEALK